MFCYLAGMDFDIVMPLTLFVVTMVAMFLNKRIEGKLKGALEEKEFRARDAAMLVAAMAVAVSIIVFVPQLAIMIVFLFSYSMLLFMFGYLFSGMRKGRAIVGLEAFVTAGLVAGVVRLTVFGDVDNALYGAVTFCGLAVFALGALLYETRRTGTGERWYLAVLPPALFIGLYLFFSQTTLWFPYLLDFYGLMFAVLIIMYLSSLFKWSITLLFVVLLTIMDIILVLFTGTMVSAARSVSALRLPVLVSLPTIPEIVYEGNRLYMSLGLGDFFFAGLLTIQTLKRYGRGIAVSAAIAMAATFAVFEVYILNFSVTAFPGTLMIICGWLIVVVAVELVRLIQSTRQPSVS